MKHVSPEMDDFEGKKTLVLKEKSLEKFKYFKKKIFVKCLADTLAKMSQNILHISSVSERYKLFFYFEKTCICCMFLLTCSLSASANVLLLTAPCTTGLQYNVCIHQINFYNQSTLATPPLKNKVMTAEKENHYQ